MTLKKLEDVARIEKTRGILPSSVEHIATFVEEPLIKACQIFFEKNIWTYNSSCNPEKDICTGHGIIEINYDTLSQENKDIANQLVENSQARYHIDQLDGNFVQIYIPTKSLERVKYVDEISNYALSIANTFKMQPMKWGYSTPEELANEWMCKEPLVNPTGFAEDNCLTYDKKRNIFWFNEIYMQKANSFRE